jgi:hypothetical protein
MPDNWKRKFDEPVELPDGRRLVTLADAIAWLTKVVPKLEHGIKQVQTAALIALLLWPSFANAQADGLDLKLGLLDIEALGTMLRYSQKIEVKNNRSSVENAVVVECEISASDKLVNLHHDTINNIPPRTSEYLEVHRLINSKPDKVDCRIRSARS